MDNLCHSLVGAALSEAGLKNRTALATATLVIGANLPDVDVLAYAWGPEAALGFRRGWTHGVLALALWPFVLTGIMIAWDRLVRRRRNPGAEPADARELLVLSVISILSHPFLDWLNTYGMRWLMPFHDVWFYGDTLFIMDVWIWLALGVGWLGSRLRRSVRPARASLAVVSLYILLMGGSQLAARRTARESLAAAGTVPGRLMAGPLPLTPFRRQIVADTGDTLALATVDWLRRPAFAPGNPPVLPENAGHPAIAAAAAIWEGAIFLHWARFPFFVVEERPDRWIVRMTDARYTINPGTGFGALTVELPKQELAGADRKPLETVRKSEGSDPALAGSPSASEGSGPKIETLPFGSRKAAFKIGTVPANSWRGAVRNRNDPFQSSEGGVQRMNRSPPASGWQGSENGAVPSGSGSASLTATCTLTTLPAWPSPRPLRCRTP